MRIDSINQTNFAAKATILNNKNAHVPFLYNQLLGISRENKLATNFLTHKIEFPSISSALIKKIKDLGIIIE